MTQRIPPFFDAAARYFLRKHAEDDLLRHKLLGRDKIRQFVLDHTWKPLKELFEAKQGLGPTEAALAPNASAEPTLTGKPVSNFSNNTTDTSADTVNPTLALPADAEAPQGAIPVPASRAKTHKAQSVQQLAEGLPEPALDEPPRALR